MHPFKHTNSIVLEPTWFHTLKMAIHIDFLVAEGKKSIVFPLQCFSNAKH